MNADSGVGLPPIGGDQRPSRIYIDVVAFAVIATVVVATHLPFAGRGMTFNDPTWYYHFGRRALAGEVPYRDYVFQVGPLPIYVDGAFQFVFGSTYLASLYAAMFILVLRSWVVWLVARRLVSWKTAMCLASFRAFDLLFEWSYHWSWEYTELFITLAGLFIWLASRAKGRGILVYLALGGFWAGMTVSARQSTAIMIIALALPSTLILWMRREFFTARRFASLWLGFAASIVLVFGALAVAGALSDSVQQMFVDAPQKKNISGPLAALDAISGGSAVALGFTWWQGLLEFLALPAALVGLCLRAASSKRKVSSRTVALLLVPTAMIVAMFGRIAALDYYSDVPRMFLTATVAVAVAWPQRLRIWLGLEPIVVVGFGALALASEWALQMSLPGRGWTDMAGMLLGIVWLSLASSHLAIRTKTLLCGALASMALLHVASFLHANLNPFAKLQQADGSLAQTRSSIDDPTMQGILVSESRAKATQWLKAKVRPGSTCFVYGSLPILYDILHCTNPTRIDVTYSDFMAVADAEAAVRALQSAPPEYLIAHERAWQNPSLEVALGATDVYSEFNSRAAQVLHGGIRTILGRYESVGTVSEAIGRELSDQSAGQWDMIEYIRVYRRRP